VGNGVTTILVAERDPLVCSVIADVLQIGFDAAVRSENIGVLAAAALEVEWFDLAIIGYHFPDISGFELAESAANHDIASLLVTGHPDALAQLNGSGYPYLRKPFRLGDLTREVADILADHAANIRRVKASVAKLSATLKGLQADIAQSRRLMTESRLLLAGRRSDDP
jgi:DNA-binding NtrC family response regulator